MAPREFRGKLRIALTRRALYAQPVKRFALVLATAAALLTAGPSAGAPATEAAMPALYKNCTALNKKYPHGVGKANARDG